jgi:RimJ/RimL family protein N-acetyltransferase
MATNEGSKAPEFTPVKLEGRVVRLEPIRREHVPLLWNAAKEALEETFRWWPYRMGTPDDFQAFMNQVLVEQERGLAIAFATVERKSGCVVGSTRFLNADMPNRRVEIGTTWIAPPWQRTAVNTDAKYLMLRYAFEHWHCLRVELKTDALNQRSRDAILRLGAKEEGTLRKHRITWNGRVRDSVYFSILDTEWPDIRLRLEQRLQR